MILPLLVSAAVFQAAVSNASKDVGVPVPPIHVVKNGVAPSWVNSCQYCRPEIYVVESVLSHEKAALQFLAYHEVCHIRDNHNETWWRLSPDQRTKAHAQTSVCMVRATSQARYRWMLLAYHRLWEKWKVRSSQPQVQQGAGIPPSTTYPSSRR